MKSNDERQWKVEKKRGRGKMKRKGKLTEKGTRRGKGKTKEEE